MSSNKKLPSFEEFADILPEPIYWADLNQVIVGFNASAIKAAGAKSKEELIGKTPLELYPKEMAEDIIAHHKEVIKTGKQMTVEESIVDITTGETKVFDATIAPLYHEDKNIIGTCGISIDTTERKRQKEQLEKKLAFQQHLFKEFAEVIPEPFYWDDLNQNILGANKVVLNAIGSDIDTVLAKKLVDFYPKEIAEQLIKNKKIVIETGKKHKFEETIRDITTGEIKVFDATIAPLYDEDRNLIGTCGISIDITERKKQEAEIIRQKNQLEKKLKFQHNYLKSAGYECLDSLKAVSNAVAEIEHRLRRLDIAAKLEYDLNDQFYILNESLSELYTMYHKLYSTVIGAEENIKYFDQKHEIPLRMENLIKTEVGLAESCISAEFDVNVSYEMDEKSKQKLDVDYRKLQHILRTLFANYTKGVNKTSRKEDIRLSITAEDGYHDTLYVTFDFKGPLPFVEVEEDEIRAEHMVYKSQTRVALDKHDFAYDVSLAMDYADVLCGNEDLNEHLFEGPYFSFTLPFRKTEDDGKGKKPHLFLVE
ncbi:PAS domain-containing protein [Caedibacter taeniospiralis]|jgi:PAS domain S-box-containing protein|uniref:PAS domain-containing protein n=1 Tax=Caedibacter taeniospiralis TaxID=28907 RepID=UPI0037BF60CC